MLLWKHTIPFCEKRNVYLHFVCDAPHLMKIAGQTPCTIYPCTECHHFFSQMNFIRRKAMTSKSRCNPADFAEIKDRYLSDVDSDCGRDHSWTSAQLRQNRHSFGSSVPLDDGSASTKWVEINGNGRKQQITSVFSVALLLLIFLPVQLIYKVKTSCCHPPFDFPNGWHVTHSPWRWSIGDNGAVYWRDRPSTWYPRMQQGTNLSSTLRSLVQYSYIPPCP